MWNLGSMLTPWVVTRPTSPEARATMTARPTTVTVVAMKRRSGDGCPWCALARIGAVRTPRSAPP